MTDQDSDKAAPVSGGPGRVPRWLILAQVAMGVAVVAVIVTSVIALRRSQPQVIVLRNPDATEAPMNADAATPQALLPDSNPDGPLGAIDHRAPQVGQPAPDFALLDLNGRRVQLSDLRGKVVVVNFWATWCGPCKQEFPELQKAYASAPNDVVVLALDQAESPSRVARFRDQYGATFTILLDSRSEVADSYLLKGIPDTIIVGRDGIVTDVSLGPLSAGTFRYKINQALKAQ